MKTLTYKCTNPWSVLQVGSVYEVQDGVKHVRCTDIKTNKVVHMYDWELAQAKLRGFLIPVDDTQSLAMSAAPCLHFTSTHYAF